MNKFLEVWLGKVTSEVLHLYKPPLPPPPSSNPSPLPVSVCFISWTFDIGSNDKPLLNTVIRNYILFS